MKSPFFQLQPSQHHPTIHSLGSFKQPSCTVNHCPFHPLPYFLSISAFNPFHFLTLQTPKIFIYILLFPQFLNSNPSCLIHCLSLLNPCTHQPNFNQYNMKIKEASSPSSYCSHILYIAQHIFLNQKQIYHAHHLQSLLASSHPGVLM